MKSLLRLLGVLISILYASSLYAQGSPNSTNSSAGTTTAGSISTPQTSASTTSGAAVSDGIPVGTTITNQNWDTYKAFMPEGMEDASNFPRITEGLLRMEFSESKIRKILGENTLRVLAECQRVASILQAEKS